MRITSTEILLACTIRPDFLDPASRKDLIALTRVGEVGAWIAQECGAGYESRSRLVALLHRRGMEHRTPKAISRKLDPEKQAAFIEKYEDLLNQLSADEAAIFGDAVNPTHAVRPVGCWAPKNIPVVITQSSGRDRLNIHGAAGLPDRATFRARLLPSFEPDRAVGGAHAQERHPQQVLRHLPRLQRRDANLPAQRRARELEHILR